jgi:hypothetical protein
MSTRSNTILNKVREATNELYAETDCPGLENSDMSPRPSLAGVAHAVDELAAMTKVQRWSAF